MCSKNNRSIDTPVKGPPQGPRLHIDIPRVQLLIEDKEGIKQIGMVHHYHYSLSRRASSRKGWFTIITIIPYCIRGNYWRNISNKSK